MTPDEVKRDQCIQKKATDYANALQVADYNPRVLALMSYMSGFKDAEKHHSEFLSYLDKDIQDGKNLLQSAKSNEDRTHIAACISTLYDVKGKFSQLINNK